MIPVASSSLAATSFTRTLSWRTPWAKAASAQGPALTERSQLLLRQELPALFQIDRPDAKALSSLRTALQQEAVSLHPQTNDGERASWFALATAERALACLPAFREQHAPAPSDGSLASTMRADARQGLMARFRACFAQHPACVQYQLASVIEPAALNALGVEMGPALAELATARREMAESSGTLNENEVLALFGAVNTQPTVTVLNAALVLDYLGVPGPIDTLRPMAHACCSAIDKLYQHNDYRVSLVQMDCGPVGADQNGVDPQWLAQALQDKRPVQVPMILGSMAGEPAGARSATSDTATHLVLECSGADVSPFSEQALSTRRVWMPVGLPLLVTGQWPCAKEDGAPARYVARAHDGEGSWYINQGLWPEISPRQSAEVNDLTPIGVEHGVQSRAIGEGRFSDVVISNYDVRPNKYLFTVDARGINIVLERTATANPRGMVLHSNLSARALAAGEVWFLSEDTVQINNGSLRYGVRTAEQWDAVARLWQALGYRVRQVGFKRRFGPDETLGIQVLPPLEEL